MYFKPSVTVQRQPPKLSRWTFQGILHLIEQIEINKIWFQGPPLLSEPRSDLVSVEMVAGELIASISFLFCYGEEDMKDP